MDIMAIMYKDATFKQQLYQDFPSLVTSSSLETTPQLPTEIFK